MRLEDAERDESLRGLPAWSWDAEAKAIRRSFRFALPVICISSRVVIGGVLRTDFNRPSVHADGFELVRHRVGDGGFTAVGHQDRRAVSGMQREQMHSRL